MYLTQNQLKNILSMKLDINCFISDRAGRKSSAVQEFFIHEALNNRPFILLRSKKDETISESWLSEYIFKKYSEKGYIFYSEKINTNITAIYFNDENGNKYLYCYGLWVSLAAKYKSNYFKGFETVKYILWEECVPNNPIQQRINFIKQNCMKEIINVLSIGSTVARDNRIQYIFLGNDISSNILNPVTISFDLLERLTPDEPIKDTTIINDKSYTFYFLYFSFKNSIEHWTINPDFDIDSTIKIKPVTKERNFVLKTNFNNYGVYSFRGFEYIAPLESEQRKEIKLISDVPNFFAYYDITDIYYRYPLVKALNFAVSLYGVPLSDVVQYFGYNWKINPVFTPEKSKTEKIIIDIEKLSKMKLNNLINSDNFNSILEFNHIIQNFNIVYHNMKLKLECERLKDLLIFYK